MTAVTPPLRTDTPKPTSVARALCAALTELGVRQAYGLVGGAIAPFSEALAKSPLEVVHCRHEGGAGFAAAEASFASGHPTLVFVTTGPGITNALTGLVAARWEGAKVVLVSASTSAALRGRGACQETSGETFPQSGLFTAGSIFHYAAVVETPEQLPEVVTRLASGFARPGGFVAHVSLPLGVQGLPVLAPLRPALSVLGAPACDAHSMRRIAGMLQSEPFVLWCGFGARHAADEIKLIAERTGARVMCTPRAKGVFPEDHPLYLGLTGLGGHASVDQYFAAHRPAHVLVLGTRLSEPTSFWSEGLVPRKGFIQVDTDVDAVGVAYPSVPTLGVQAEIRGFLQALSGELGAKASVSQVSFPGLESPATPALRREGRVRPQALMASVQRVIIDRHDVPVMTESGNAFAWGNHLLRFRRPHRYRVSTGFGSMGHAATGVVGSALGRGGKAVALLGDGAMLMGTEVSTAVQYRAKAVWIVLNDARYSMVDQGMRALGFEPVETALPETDFVLFARALGAHGARVENELELDAKLEEAMAAPGPFVVDVQLDRDAPAPWMRRIQNLILQGAEGSQTEGGAESSESSGGSR